MQRAACGSEASAISSRGCKSVSEVSGTRCGSVAGPCVRLWSHLAACPPGILGEPSSRSRPAGCHVAAARKRCGACRRARTEEISAMTAASTAAVPMPTPSTGGRRARQCPVARHPRHPRHVALVLGTHVTRAISGRGHGVRSVSGRMPLPPAEGGAGVGVGVANAEDREGSATPAACCPTSLANIRTPLESRSPSRRPGPLACRSACLDTAPSATSAQASCDRRPQLAASARRVADRGSRSGIDPLSQPGMWGSRDRVRSARGQPSPPLARVGVRSAALVGDWVGNCSPVGRAGRNGRTRASSDVRGRAALDGQVRGTPALVAGTRCLG